MQFPTAPAPSLSPAELRSAVAFAEAILPGGPTVPRADEALVRRTSTVLRDVAGPALDAWLAAQRALDAAAIAFTGRRFSSLTAKKQDRLLARWLRDPVLRGPLGLVAFAYKFVHFDTGSAQGARARLETVRQLEQPSWLSQIHRAEEWPADEDVECEVVVIGTGAGGAVVGRELADRGLAVVFVEEGEHHRRDAMTGSSLDAHYKFYRGALSVGNAPFPIFAGRMVGGSTAINTGSCFRTPSWVLDEWCEALGSDALSSAAMTPHFDRVERVLGVEAPARKFIGPIADVVDRGCDALGWARGPVLRNASGCEGSGFCDFGCATDARRSTNLSYVPPALQKGALLLTGLRAERVLLDGGRARGIVGVTKAGRRVRIRAEAVVLAGGALSTPLFLLKNGLCTSSGQVGKNLTLHPSGGFSGLFDERIAGREHIPQGYHVSEFLRDGVLVSAAQADANFSAIVFPYVGQTLMSTLEKVDRIASFGVLIRDSAPRGHIALDAGGHILARYDLAREDVERMHRGMVRTGEMLLAAGAKTLYPVLAGATPVETAAEWRAFRERVPSPAELMLTSYHPLGTCKMGRDPKKSVVGLDHQAHDVPGLYVVDGSTVPSAPGVNPQITIMAMATRASLSIAERLGYPGSRIEREPSPPSLEAPAWAAE